MSLAEQTGTFLSFRMPRRIQKRPFFGPASFMVDVTFASFTFASFGGCHLCIVRKRPSRSLQAEDSMPATTFAARPVGCLAAKGPHGAAR